MQLHETSIAMTMLCHQLNVESYHLTAYKTAGQNQLNKLLIQKETWIPYGDEIVFSSLQSN
ncbi:hypothetical protein KY285_007379 [Solanum tuberosum]|nr:hypothetical protein KY285_007379 [Solanum tuberosum]